MKQISLRYSSLQVYSNLIPTYYIAAHNVPDPNQPGWPAATGFLVQAAAAPGEPACIQQPVQVNLTKP